MVHRPACAGEYPLVVLVHLTGQLFDRQVTYRDVNVLVALGLFRRNPAGLTPREGFWPLMLFDNAACAGGPKKCWPPKQIAPQLHRSRRTAIAKYFHR
jgi:hypothetical protein